ncbi:MAG: hypothetical protein ABGY75_22685 [Gemmataceae bacterium]
MLAPCLLALVLAPAADPKPRLDADGLPLPAEAVQRFGSQRFLVNHLKAAAFSPDGKTVYTISEEDAFDDRITHSSPGLIAWQVPTGKKLWQVGVDRRFEQVAADPDGKSVWVVEQVFTEDAEPWITVRVRYSAADGKELARTAPIENGSPVSLHPTGLIAYMSADEDMKAPTMRVTDGDWGTTDIRLNQPEKEGSQRDILWSPGADRLFVIGWYSDRKASWLTAIDRKARKQLWSVGTDLVGGWGVTPDGKTVFVFTRVDEEKAPAVARRFDAATGNATATLEMPNLGEVHDLGRPVMNGYGRVHMHPDGKRLYLNDRHEQTITLDVVTWKTVGAKTRIPEHAVFSPDGRMYAAPSGRHVVIRETATGERLSPDGPKLPPATDTVLERYTPHDWMTYLQVSPSGNRLIRAGGYDGVRVEWEVPSGREVSRAVTYDDTYRWERAVRSADGRKIAVPFQIGKNWRVRVSDAERPNAPPVELRVKGEGDDCPWYLLQFTPDGNHLIAFSRQKLLWIWDVERGGAPREVSCWWDGSHTSHSLTVGFPTRADGQQFAALLFNDRQGFGQSWIATGPTTWRVGVYDLPSAKPVKEFTGEGAVVLLAWSPAGGLVILTDHTHYPNFHLSEKQSEPRFDLIHLDPTTEQKRVTRLDGDVRCCAMAPVGDAVAVGSSDGLRVYEAGTGKLRHRFREQTRPVQVVAFSPDGRSLAAESVDGPLLLWDVRGDLSKPAKPDAAGWDTAWAALGGDGAEAAFRAVRLFALHPEEGTAELKRRFAGRKPPTAEAVAALVAQLDDRDYATRERATRELRELGFAAFPALKKALADNPPEELRARAERLLAATTNPDVRRAERAVEAMQLANTEAARKVLAEWAKGPADDVLTVAAKRLP